MSRIRSTLVNLGNGFLLMLLFGVLTGLPLAVEMDLPIARLGGKAVLSRMSDAVAVHHRISLSNHLPLTLDSGLVSPAAADVVPNGGAVRLQIDEPAFTLDLSRDAVPDAVAAVETETALIASIGGFRSGALRLRRGRLVVVSVNGTRYLISDINATIEPVRHGQFKLTGSGRHNGEALALEASWSVPAARGDAPVPLRMVLRSAVMEATFDGLLGSKGISTLTGRTDIRIPSLGKLITWAGLGDNIGDRVRSIHVSGPLVWSPKQMAFAPANVDVDGNRAVGALTLRHAGARPAVDATLAFNELRLPPIFGDADNEKKQAAAAKDVAKGRLLALFDADLRLSAARITMPGVELGRGAITVALSRGRLEADLVGLELESGSAEGRFTLDVTKPAAEASLKFKAKAIDVGYILGSAGPLPVGAFKGRADLAFEGQASGTGMASVMSRLAGHGQLRLVEAGHLGLDLPALIAAARSTPVVSWAAAGKGATTVDNLLCRFRVLNGAITIEALQARSGERALFGTGRIDVPGRLMDVSLGEGPAATGEAPITTGALLSMSGTWASPAIRLIKLAPGQRPELAPSPGN